MEAIVTDDCVFRWIRRLCKCRILMMENFGIARVDTKLMPSWCRADAELISSWCQVVAKSMASGCKRKKFVEVYEKPSLRSLRKKFKGTHCTMTKIDCLSVAFQQGVWAICTSRRGQSLQVCSSLTVTNCRPNLRTESFKLSSAQYEYSEHSMSILNMLRAVNYRERRSKRSLLQSKKNIVCLMNSLDLHNAISFITTN